MSALLTADHLFLVAKLFWTILNPVQAALIVLFLSSTLFLTSWRRIGKYLFWSVGSFLVLIGLIPGAIWSASLENYFPRPQLLPQEQVGGIIILGGSIYFDKHTKSENLDPSKGQRIIGSIALVKQYPDVQVIYSGRSSRINYEGKSEGYYARKIFKQLGVQRKISYENHSRNTYENARYSRFLITETEKPWFLVTSAIHLPRSVGIFRKAGWKIIPYPVDYAFQHDSTFGAFQLMRYRTFNIVMKEYLGLLVFYALNQTDRLLPLRQTS